MSQLSGADQTSTTSFDSVLERVKNSEGENGMHARIARWVFAFGDLLIVLGMILLMFQAFAGDAVTDSTRRTTGNLVLLFFTAFAYANGLRKGWKARLEATTETNLQIRVRLSQQRMIGFSEDLRWHMLAIGLIGLLRAQREPFLSAALFVLVMCVANASAYCLGFWLGTRFAVQQVNEELVRSEP